MKRKPKKSGNGSAATKPPSPPPPIGRHEDYERCDGGGNGDKKTPKANHPTHRTAYVEAACAVLIVVITGFYTYYANQQAGAAINAANAATSSAQTATKTLEMDRPYVSIELVPTSHLGFTPEGNGYLRLGSTVVNYGRTPALNARIWVQFLSQSKSSPKSETDPNAFCESLQGKGNSSIESIFGGTYLPQVPYKASWIVTESAAAKVFMPTLIACIAYQSPFSKDWLWAGEMYTIQRARHAKLGGTLLPLRGETIPQKDLVLAPFPNSAMSK